MYQQTNELPPKRALAYIRISSNRQVNGESPETQKEAIQRYADSENIEIVKWYNDEAKSGKNADRKELQNLLNESLRQKGKIDHVIVYKMNRASRDIDTYITGIRMKLKERGISVRSATERFDDSPIGHLLEIFHVMVGQLDNEDKRGFTVDNMRRLAEQGYWQNAPIVGYSIGRVMNDAGKSRPILVQNNMAPLVKQVLERYSEGNITKAELTRYAASVGLRSRYGNKLSQDRIHALIKHPAYAGYIANNHTDWQLVQGKHEEVISKDTYDLNQTLLFGKRVRAGERRLAINPDYPLKSLLRCPMCKKALYASAPKTGAGGVSPRYHCSRFSCKGQVKSIKASTMHEEFVEMLKRVKPDERVIQLYKEVLIAEATNRLGSLNAKISKMRTELDRIAENRLSVIKKFSKDQLTLEDKNELVDSYDQDKLVITDDLDTLLSQQSIQEADIEFALNVMERVDIQWSEVSLGSQQRFQSMLFPEGLEYDYENHRFGTSQISPLYRYAPIKKDSEVTSKSFLVAGAGFEPAT